MVDNDTPRATPAPSLAPFAIDLTQPVRRSIDELRAMDGRYADIPGTGPRGATCRTCNHLIGKRCARLAAGRDADANSPACRQYSEHP